MEEAELTLADMREHNNKPTFDLRIFDSLKSILNMEKNHSGGSHRSS